MCAATSQMVAKVAELMELRKMIEDLNAEAELLADEIKAYMGDEETMTAGSYVVRYQNVVSQRCDTKDAYAACKNHLNRRN